MMNKYEEVLKDIQEVLKKHNAIITTSNACHEWFVIIINGDPSKPLEHMTPDVIYNRWGDEVKWNE